MVKSNLPFKKAAWSCHPIDIVCKLVLAQKWHKSVTSFKGENLRPDHLCFKRK